MNGKIVDKLKDAYEAVGKAVTRKRQQALDLAIDAGVKVKNAINDPRMAGIGGKKRVPLAAALAPIADVFTDNRLAGLGGKRGLEAKINIAKGVQKVVDGITDKGRLLDPTLRDTLKYEKYTDSAHGLFHNLYNEWTGLLRRADTKKTLANISKNDVAALNDFIYNPGKLKRNAGRYKRLIRNWTSAGGDWDKALKNSDKYVSTKIDVSAEDLKNINALTHFINSATGSVASPSAKEITPKLRGKVSRLYNTLGFGSYGGIGYMDTDNGGVPAVWKKVDGKWKNIGYTGAGKHDFAKGAELVPRGMGGLIPDTTKTGAPGPQGLGHLEYIRLGKKGDKVRVGSRIVTLSDDVGVTGYNNAGVFNVEDPVYNSGADGAAFGVLFRKSKIPMGSVMESNIADMLDRMNSMSDDGSQLYVKGLTTGAWGDLSEQLVEAPKAVVVNEAGKDIWQEIMDSHIRRRTVDGDSIPAKHVSDRAMRWLDDSKKLLNTQQDVLDNHAKNPDAVNELLKVPKQRYAFDLFFPNRDKTVTSKGDWYNRIAGPYTEINSGKALKSIIDSGYKRDLMLDDAKKIRSAYGDVAASKWLINEMKKEYDAALDSQQRISDDVNKVKAEFIEQLGGGLSDLEVRDPGNRLLIKEVANGMGYSDNDAAAIADQIISGQKKLPTDFKTYLRDYQGWPEADIDREFDTASGKAADALRDRLKRFAGRPAVDELKKLSDKELRNYLESRNFDYLSDKEIDAAIDYIRTGKAATPKVTEWMNSKLRNRLEELSGFKLDNDPRFNKVLDMLDLVDNGDSDYTDIAAKLHKQLRGDDKLVSALIDYIRTGNVAEGYREEDLVHALIQSELLKTHKKVFDRLAGVRNRMFTTYENNPEDLIVNRRTINKHASISKTAALAGLLKSAGSGKHALIETLRYWLSKPEVGKEGMDTVNRLVAESDTFLPSAARLKKRLSQLAHQPGSTSWKGIKAVARAPIDLLNMSVLSGNPSSLWSKESLARDLVANTNKSFDQQLASMNLGNRTRQILAMEGAAGLAGTTGLGYLTYKGLTKDKKEKKKSKFKSPKIDWFK